jgi:type I restriction enzyme S subunit
VPEQSAELEAITRLLDAADDAIESTQAAADRARELRDAILQRFFYGALGETAYADRPRKELPQGWQLLPTGKLLAEDPKNGLSPEASTQPPGVPTFSIAAIRNGRLDLQTGEHLKYARIPDLTATPYHLRRGDVLVVRGNANPDLVGKAAMVGYFPEGCIYPDITKRVLFRSGGGPSVSPEFAVLAWNHSIVHNQVVRRAKTSNGTLKINNRDVKQIVLPVPPLPEQATLVQLTASIDAEIDAVVATATAQQQLKKSIMVDLLTGRRRVISL